MSFLSLFKVREKPDAMEVDPDGVWARDHELDFVHRSRPAESRATKTDEEEEE